MKVCSLWNNMCSPPGSLWLMALHFHLIHPQSRPEVGFIISFVCQHYCIDSEDKITIKKIIISIKKIPALRVYLHILYSCSLVSGIVRSLKCSHWRTLVLYLVARKGISIQYGTPFCYLFPPNLADTVRSVNIKLQWIYGSTGPWSLSCRK